MSKYDRIDKFNLEKMTDAESAKKQDYVSKKCKCTGCPSYVKGDNPVAYCYPVIGTSKKIQWEKECVCATCPVYKEYELDYSFYCTRCSQSCQALKVEGGAGHD